MADKLSRIIRENESSKSEATKSIIQEIKKQLVAISKTRKKPDISFEMETDIEINIPIERKLTFDQKEDITYTNKPEMADGDITSSQNLSKLFLQSNIDKELLRKRIKDILKENRKQHFLMWLKILAGLKEGCLNYLDTLVS